MFIFMFSTIVFCVLSIFLSPILRDYGVVKPLQLSLVNSILAIILTMPVSWVYDKITVPDDTEKSAQNSLVLSRSDLTNTLTQDADGSNLISGTPSVVPFENIPNSELTPEQRKQKAEARELNEAMKNLKMYQGLQ